MGEAYPRAAGKLELTVPGQGRSWIKSIGTNRLEELVGFFGLWGIPCAGNEIRGLYSLRGLVKKNFTKETFREAERDE